MKATVMHRNREAQIAVGNALKRFPAIYAVANGISDTKNKNARFVQITMRLAYSALRRR
jgi:hypothetical protein